MADWKIITGYPDYAIKKDGTVKSLRFNRILKSSSSNSGYMYVNLIENKIKKSTAIHRLVMEHFGSPRPGEKYVIDHKNGIKEDNRLENLEWVSIKENTLRAYNNSDIKKRVLELRSQGMTMQEIAKEVGKSLSFVHQTIHNT